MTSDEHFLTLEANGEQKCFARAILSHFEIFTTKPSAEKLYTQIWPKCF